MPAPPGIPLRKGAIKKAWRYGNRLLTRQPNQGKHEAEHGSKVDAATNLVKVPKGGVWLLAQ
jgi:hypothetical protein